MIRKATVEGGVVLGIPAADPRVTAFKGIPFAAPPVGENRWRAPQPVIPWEGELKCWNFAPISMQHIPGLDPNNIYTREDLKRLRPDLYWKMVKFNLRNLIFFNCYIVRYI